MIVERVDVGTAELACLVAGEPGRPLVVCAHGFPDCARSFRLQVPALVAAGFRVVAPYLRGYAPSGLARDGRYDPATIGGDLCALVQHYSPRAPAALVGHDWGAVAAYAATALEPERFRRLCTLAVPHLRISARRYLRPSQLRRSWYVALFQLRDLAERRLRAHNFHLVDRLWRDWSPGFQPPAAELDAVKAALAPEAHLRAVLAYYRAFGDRAAARRSRPLLFARTRVPSLYMHGCDDGCVGVELSEGVEKAYVAGVTVHRFDGAGHFLHQEKPDAFNALLVDFLR
jgi:pimeloyl-ACP methyl ester carboxylesterase